MGRKKIKIQPIKEDRNRSVTYLKRKAGLFKKAHELAVLTDSQVAVIVFGHNGKLAEFCSTDIDLLLLRYTEYDGVAERKGPQNYLDLDRDSDDNDDDDENDDMDMTSADGAADDFNGSSGSNRPGAADRQSTSSASSNAKGGGGGSMKRKAGQMSSSSSNKQLHPSNLLACTSSLGSGYGIANASTAKQTVNATLRRKSQTQAGSGLVSTQAAFQPMHISPSFMSGSAMQHVVEGAPMHIMGSTKSVPAMPQPNTGVADQNPRSNDAAANTNKAGAIADMSISMPSDDRLPIFVSPATPGFGLTPGGTIITPGGRRFSFSDVLPRSTSNSTIQRPVTSSSTLVPHYFHADMLGYVATPPPVFDTMSSSSPLENQQDPSVTPAFQTRTAEPALQRYPAPMYSEVTYAPSSVAHMASSDPTGPGADTTANNEAGGASNHLTLRAAGLGQTLHASSASPMPTHTSADANAASNAFYAGSSAGPNVKAAVTPLRGSYDSSATPELLSHSSSALSRPGLAASASKSAASTDEETPPLYGSGVVADPSRLDPSSAWLPLPQGADRKPNQAVQEQDQEKLVRPAPFDPTQPMGSAPFELRLPPRRTH
ncbi:transcription factor [Pseudozyma hubeiensis SY62]|uniref:Transcription factor n=1 Tax=Pseudozyma hubeiensis (strain SY62) TaxID=1305764 RepID=R9P9A4_PSEHS|nr:transcription factor [Pseudozyma hubeiensis SY62]GAC97924.1 transcription factor [Pseudozyma hubeiensis SY62]